MRTLIQAEEKAINACSFASNIFITDEITEVNTGQATENNEKSEDETDLWKQLKDLAGYSLSSSYSPIVFVGIGLSSNLWLMS